MSQYIQADTGVVNNLLSRFEFTSYASIVAARVVLAQAIRLSMQHPQCYTAIPLNQNLPEQFGVDAAAQYVHPWNIAAALMNVCVNGARFGGENLAPQEDLQIHLDTWRPLMGNTFPTAVVTMATPPAPAPAPITPAPVAASVPAPAPAPAPAPEPERAVSMSAALGVGYGGAQAAAAPTGDVYQSAAAAVYANEETRVGTPGLDAIAAGAGAAPEPSQAYVAAETAVFGAPRPLPGQTEAPVRSVTGTIEPRIEAHGSNLPDPDIRAARTGGTGRPQKSPFEKKVESRNKVAEPAFWWKSMLVMASKIFTKSPASALDDSSTGAGPVQSYMVLVAFLQEVLKDVPAETSVAALRNYLREVDGQVSELEWAEAANQLRKTLMFH